MASYTVTVNAPGYPPAADPLDGLTWDEALETLKSEIAYTAVSQLVTCAEMRAIEAEVRALEPGAHTCHLITCEGCGKRTEVNHSPADTPPNSQAAQ